MQKCIYSFVCLCSYFWEWLFNVSFISLIVIWFCWWKYINLTDCYFFVCFQAHDILNYLKMKAEFVVLLFQFFAMIKIVEAFVIFAQHLIRKKCSLDSYLFRLDIFQHKIHKVFMLTSFHIEWNCLLYKTLHSSKHTYIHDWSSLKKLMFVCMYSLMFL